MGNDIKAIEDSIAKYEKQGQDFKDRHSKLCDFFQLEAKDEKRDSSDEFFKFWKQFVKEIESNLPKEEKKRAGASRK